MEADGPITLPNDSTDMRRDRIIHYASRAFMRHGFEETNLDEISADAHVSKPTIYQLFGNKEALLRAVILQAVNDTVGPISAPLSSDRPLADALIAFAAQYIAGMYRRVAQGEPFFMLSRLMISVSIDRPDLAQQFMNIYSEAIMAKLKPAFAQLAGAAMLDPCDPAELVHAFLHALFYTNHEILSGSAAPTEAVIAEQARTRVRLFLYGCYPRDGQPSSSE